MSCVRACPWTRRRRFRIRVVPHESFRDLCVNDAIHDNLSGTETPERTRGCGTQLQEASRLQEDDGGQHRRTRPRREVGLTTAAMTLKRRANLRLQTRWRSRRVACATSIQQRQHTHILSAQASLTYFKMSAQGRPSSGTAIPGSNTRLLFACLAPA